MAINIKSESSSERLRPNAKHVSKACLECRSRHLKCSGSQPCSRCEKLSKDCTYVKSHRGGSRKKGVSKFDKKRNLKLPKSKEITPVSMSTTNSNDSRSEDYETKPVLLEKKPSHSLGYNIPPVEDLIQLPCINHKKSANQRRKDYADLLKMPCAFTCLEPQYRGKTPPCMGGEVRVSNNEKIDLSKVPLSATSSFYEKVNSNDYMKKMMNDINIDDVIEVYYNNFHSIHPLLPDRSEIKDYLNAVPHAYELILAMKMVGDAQSSAIYANDIETVNFKLNQIFDYINTVVGIDVISLQAMALVSLIAHFSSLHDLSARVRVEAVKALLSQGYNMVDYVDNNQQHKQSLKGAPESPESEKEYEIKGHKRFLSSDRLSRLSESVIVECARKVFWEVHFIDVVIGTADGRTISKLATSDISVNYPVTVSPHVFDYKSRAEGCQLVTEAIKLNISVIDQQLTTSSINLLNTSLGNWEMRLSHPEMLNAPFMVDANGNINEGVFQAMLLYNYAKIFAHRPFSYLWKDMAIETEEKMGPNKQTISSRKIIETRKTIDGANLIATCLLDTSPSSIQKRTPLYGCSVAFACLVHLSSYIWSKSSLATIPVTDTVTRRNVEEELKEYLQYIQFELNTLFVISRHWMLANKLSSYVKETLSKVTPELYESIKHMLPRINNNQSVRTVSMDSEYPETTSNETPNGRILKFNEEQTSKYVDVSPSDIQTNSTPQLSNNDNSLNEIDFTNYDFNSDNVVITPKLAGIPDSPMSDTGCDWIDKNIFEFDGDEFKNILDSYGPE